MVGKEEKTMSALREEYDDEIEDNVPESREGFEELRNKSEEELLDMGMKKWNEELLLFPKEWYDYIPNGFEVYTILDEKEMFGDDSSKDSRFGCLPYGIRI